MNGDPIVSSMLPAAPGWEQVAHPPSLFRRFVFAAYRETRAFLDRLAVISQETGLYPDLGFGTTYVNVTVRTSDGSPGALEIEFANRVSALVPAVAATV
jgi:pterin-4a-carbinolamine dehydratase